MCRCHAWWHKLHEGLPQAIIWLHRLRHSSNPLRIPGIGMSCPGGQRRLHPLGVGHTEGCDPGLDVGNVAVCPPRRRACRRVLLPAVERLRGLGWEAQEGWVPWSTARLPGAACGAERPRCHHGVAHVAHVGHMRACSVSMVCSRITQKHAASGVSEGKFDLPRRQRRAAWKALSSWYRGGALGKVSS
jgi:hypothetical protein